MIKQHSGKVVWHHAVITRMHREKQNGHRSVLLWFTGLPCSGKSTLAHAVEEELHKLRCRTIVLDGDNVRHGLCADLGFSMEDRSENLRRIGEASKLFIEAGLVTLAAFVSPAQSDRNYLRSLMQDGDFIEIYCKCSLDVCEARDVKGMYGLARAGAISNFTGISSPYEEPEKPELVVNTDRQTIEESVQSVLQFIENNGYWPKCGKSSDFTTVPI